MKREHVRNNSRSAERGGIPSVLELHKRTRSLHFLALSVIISLTGCLESRKIPLDDFEDQASEDQSSVDQSSVDFERIDDAGSSDGLDMGTDELDLSLVDQAELDEGLNEPPSILPPSLRSWSLSGEVTFADRDYSASGWTGNHLTRSTPYVKVELLQSSSDQAEQVIAEGRTDQAGRFTLRWSSLEQGQQGETSWVLRVYAEQQTQGANQAEVRSRSGQLYTLETSMGIDQFIEREQIWGTSWHAEIGAVHAEAESPLSGALNILSMTERGFTVIERYSDFVAPRLRFTWDMGRAVSCGSCYVGDEVLLGGQPDDPDHYDDHIILHEMGHYFTHRWSVDSSPGGPHRGRAVDPTLAYGEGVAYFWAAMVLRDPVIVDWMVPTPWVVDLEQDIFNGQPITIGLFGRTSSADEQFWLSAEHHEELVSTLMWDVFDPIGESGDDPLEVGEEAMMEGLVNWLPLWHQRGLDVGGLGVDLADWLAIMTCQEVVNPQEIEQLCEQRDYPWTVNRAVGCEQKSDSPRLMIHRDKEGALWATLPPNVSSAGEVFKISRIYGDRSEWKPMAPVECAEFPCVVMYPAEVNKKRVALLFIARSASLPSSLELKGSWTEDWIDAASPLKSIKRSDGSSLLVQTVAQ